MATFYKVGDTVFISDKLNIVNKCFGTIIGIYNNGNTIKVKTETPGGTPGGIWLLKPKQLEKC